MLALRTMVAMAKGSWMHAQGRRSFSSFSIKVVEFGLRREGKA